MFQVKTNYDTIIIGAGIGGLVCGCYLAKAGMKVLMCEQHNKPGGYCSSFERHGFIFDTAAHCFGGYRKGGMTRKIFEDLEIDKKIKITRADPLAIIITPDYKVSFRTDLDEIIKNLQTTFPDESNNIRNFFYFLTNPDHASFARIRSWTLKDLLDQHFSNYKLKAILASPLFGIRGLPPSLLSAFVGTKLFSEFFIDGGYFPENGFMQEIPDALAEKFKEFGGELRLSSPVKKIRAKDNKATGIILEDGGFIQSKYVISNCDARQTFLKLLGREKLNTEFYDRLKNMIPSISYFILHLGMDRCFDTRLSPVTSIGFFKHYDLETAYHAAQRCDINGFGGHLICLSHDKSSILALIPMAYKSKRYWDKNKDKFSESLIEQIERYTIPNLSKHIIYKEAATPHTLYKTTLNYKGAGLGWACIPSQLVISDFKKPFFIDGLYLTGHWTTLGAGISGTAYAGYDTAKIILKKTKP
ncbi:MAG: NAD(P)/FAD-dependent oxidoreductase [Nitrospirota bacterium]